YKFVDRRKFSRARFALAAGDAGREHWSDYFEDGPSPWPNDRDGSYAARHTWFGRGDSRFLPITGEAMSTSTGMEPEFAEVMQDLSAQASPNARSVPQADLANGISAALGALHSLGQRIEALEET